MSKMNWEDSEENDKDWKMCKSLCYRCIMKNGQQYIDIEEKSSYIQHHLTSE